MPLYVLTLLSEKDVEEVHPDYSCYIDSCGFVIIAPDEATARQLARGEDGRYDAAWWNDTKVTKCETLPYPENAEPRVLLGNWPTG